MYNVIQEKMKSITDKFFTGCKKIKVEIYDEDDDKTRKEKLKKSKKNLKDYQEKAIEYSNSKCLLRYTEHISGTEFKADWVSDDSDDVYVNHYDEHGNRQVFVKEYIITRTGQVYYIDNDGSPKPMTLHKQKGCFQLYIKDANGKSIQIQPKQTFLQCTSYFVDYDWKVVMQNRGKTGKAQVDHVLQENEPNVDIQCLDLVTHTENMHRKSLDPKNEKTINKIAESQGKPFTITIQENGKVDIVLNATSSRNGEDLLKQQGFTIGDRTIRNYLNGKGKKEFMQNGKTVIFKYTEEFLEDQKDLLREIWRTEEEWNLAKEIIKEFENKRAGPPKAISNCGRIKTNKDIKKYGIYVSDGVHRYNGALVHRLVGLAFHDYIENDPKRQGYTPENTVVRHINDNELEKRGIDVEKKYRTDKEGRKVLSNHIDTLEFGTQKENMQDLSNKMIYEAQQISMNKFRVTPLRNDHPEIPGTFHSIREFLNFVEEQKIEVTFNDGNVRQALNGERNSASGYKFTYEKSRVETQ